VIHFGTGNPWHGEEQQKNETAHVSRRVHSKNKEKGSTTIHLLFCFFFCVIRVGLMRISTKS